MARRMGKVVIDGVPNLWLFADNNICVGDQLLFDYVDDTDTYSRETRYV